MISLLQDMKKHKFIVMIIACIICGYVAISLTGFLASNASDNDNVRYSFVKLTDSATNYLDHSNAPKEGSGTKILDGATFANAGGLVGAADPNVQAYIGHISESNGNEIKYSYSMLDEIYAERDKDTGVGDITTKSDGPLVYARYGYLLQDLGMDETTDKTLNSGLRMIVGIAFMLMYLLSLGVNAFFSVILTVLQYANPFRLFYDPTAIRAPGTGEHPLAQWMTSIAAPDASDKVGYAAYQGVVNLISKLSNFYERLYNMSFFVVMPVFLALTIFSITILNGKKSMLTNETTTFGKIKSFLIRFTFVVLGVPIMFSCYASTIDYLKDVTVTSNAAGTKIVASTFLDFSTWATEDRLGLPDDVDIVADISDTAKGRNGIIGLTSSDTSKNVRKYTYLINHNTKAIHGLSGDYGITDFSSDNSKAYDSVNMDNQDAKSINADYSTVADIMNMLSRYSKGQTIDCSTFASFETSKYFSDTRADNLAWQQMVADSQAYSNFDPELAKQQDAEPPKATDENDGADTDEDTDGEEETTEEPATEETETASNYKYRVDDAGDKTAAAQIAEDRLTNVTNWKNCADDAPSGKIAINPWANGGLEYSSVNPNQEHYSQGKYNEHKYHGGFNPGNKTKLDNDASGAKETYGLSTMAMYNYLASEFSADGVTVHYAGKQNYSFAHYQVVNVGSGAAKWLYLIDALVLMSCLSIVGYGYGIALLFHNFRAMFKVIPAVFTGMLGSLRGIGKALALMFALIVEVLATILLYYISTEFVAHCTDLVELPFTILISNLGTTVNNLLSPIILVVGIIAVIGITKKLLDWRQVIVNSTTGYITSVINKLFGTDVQAPDLSQGGSTFGQRAINFAGGAAMLGMASGGLSGTGTSLAEKLGVGGATSTGAAETGVGEFGERVGDTVGGESTTNVNDGSTTTQYNDSYDPSQTYGGATNSTVGDVNSNLDAYGGENYEGDNSVYDGNDAAYMQDDTSEGDTISDVHRDENSYNNASDYVNANSGDFLNNLHSNTDQINQNKQLGNTTNANSNVNAKTNADTQQQIADVNKSEMFAQGSNVVDMLSNAADYTYSNDANIKTNAAANLQANYGNMKAMHEDYNNQRANIMNGGGPVTTGGFADKGSGVQPSGMEGDPRYQASGQNNTSLPTDGQMPNGNSNPTDKGRTDGFTMNPRPDADKKGNTKGKTPTHKLKTYGPNDKPNTPANMNNIVPTGMNPNQTVQDTVSTVDKMAGNTDSPNKVNVEKKKTTGGYTQSTSQRPTAVPFLNGFMGNTGGKDRRNNNSES